MDGIGSNGAMDGLWDSIDLWGGMLCWGMVANGGFLGRGVCGGYW